MKLATLWEPWATLMALGLKRFETRGWRTNYRGWLAIHAAQGGLPLHELEDQVMEPKFQEALLCDPAFQAWHGCRERIQQAFPFGCIIAVVKVVDCARIEMCDRCDGCGWYEGGPTLQTQCEECGGCGGRPGGYRLSPAEAAFGNYAPGRYALITDQVRRLVRPIPFKSRQGKLLDVPPEIEAQIREQLAPKPTGPQLAPGQSLEEFCDLYGRFA